MRAFRVIRLFGRLGSLRDIINALTAAIVPVRSPVRALSSAPRLQAALRNMRATVKRADPPQSGISSCRPP